jgi:peptidyl-dipeptidase A
MSETTNLTDRINSFDEQIRSLAIRENEASFSMYRGLEHEDLNELEAKMAGLWLSEEVVDISMADAPSDDLARPLQLLKMGVLRTRVEGREEIYTAKNDANEQLVEYQLELDGEPISRTDLGEVLRHDRDPEKRRRAANAFVPLEKVLHDKVLELINKRNAAAKVLGYKSFPHMAFELEELNLEEVIKQLVDLLERGNDSFKAILDEFRDAPDVSGDKLLSSDVRYIFENHLPNLPNDKFPKDELIGGIQRGYFDIGIDLESLPIETVIQDIPAGGFCFTFDPGRDIRILANPRDGHLWYQVMFHEFGHAVHGSYANGNGNYFVALADPSFFWEGIAVTFEKLSMRKSFLASNVGDTAAIDNFLEGARKRLTHRVRSLSLAALFEYSLYLEPAPYEQLRKRLGDMVRKYMFVEPACDPPTFTHDIFQITHPCYIQNYVIAEMIAAQLFESSDSKNGDPWNVDFAKQIVNDLLIPAGMKVWRDKIEGMTGKPLSSDAVIGYLYS